MMLQQYRNDHGRVKGKLKAVMAFVKELYSERDTLTTELKVNTVAIEHAAGKNWGTTKWRYLVEIIFHFLVTLQQMMVNKATLLEIQSLFCMFIDFH